MVKSLEELSSRRVDAFSGRDAREYHVLCNELGIEPEDPALYDEGMAVLMYEESRERELSDVRDESNQQVEYWARLARIAYRRFPALGKGESIQDRELSSRLREIREAGYSVPPYSRLTKKAKWELLRQIKQDVRGQARAHGAAFALREIAQKNDRLRQEEREFR